MTLEDWKNICLRITNLSKRVENYNKDRGAMISKTFVGFLETQLTNVLKEVQKYS